MRGGLTGGGQRNFCRKLDMCRSAAEQRASSVPAKGTGEMRFAWCVHVSQPFSWDFVCHYCIKIHKCQEEMKKYSFAQRGRRSGRHLCKKGRRGKRRWEREPGEAGRATFRCGPWPPPKFGRGKKSRGFTPRLFSCVILGVPRVSGKGEYLPPFSRRGPHSPPAAPGRRP